MKQTTYLATLPNQLRKIGKIAKSHRNIAAIPIGSRQAAVVEKPLKTILIKHGGHAHMG